ncbi:hypothetical protein HYDPIDRAFT_111575 [Hydnomerulius pinastri MD-312]|uniref:Uncharacterized protein n=1 Tax=Hydnomerulius pinastri MD-312 TaxID=994086 RepID=A0A0C9WG68_9AGAM|nr:hypothetical protein HYDPIDRAFT_111575 [Hydnomerulius pinastri MD-312]
MVGDRVGFHHLAPMLTEILHRLNSRALLSLLQNSEVVLELENASVPRTLQFNSHTDSHSNEQSRKVCYNDARRFTDKFDANLISVLPRSWS